MFAYHLTKLLSQHRLIKSVIMHVVIYLPPYSLYHGVNSKHFATRKVETANQLGMPLVQIKIHNCSSCAGVDPGGVFGI